MVWIDSSSREGFLEVHKTPKEIWLKELEGINAKTSIKTQVMTPPPVKVSYGYENMFIGFS